MQHVWPRNYTFPEKMEALAFQMTEISSKKSLFITWDQGNHAGA